MNAMNGNISGVMGHQRDTMLEIDAYTNGMMRSVIGAGAPKELCVCSGIGVQRANGLRRMCLLLGMLMLLGRGYVFGASTSYYSSKLTATADGAGKVYVSENTTENKSGAKTEVSATKLKVESNSNHTYYLWAYPDDGYYLASWGGSSDVSPDGSRYKMTIKASSTNEKSPTEGSATAYFEPVDLRPGRVSAIHPTDVDALYEGEVKFTTSHADAEVDFSSDIRVEMQEGAGTFTAGAFRWAGDTLTVPYTFRANGARGDHSAIMMVYSAGEENSAEAILSAHFVQIEQGESVLTETVPLGRVEATATFATHYAIGKEDFVAPEFVRADVGTWEVTGYTFADDVVRIEYAYTAPATEGEYSADLQLATTAGETNTVACRVEVLAAVSYDAEVLSANGENLAPSGATLEEAVVLANSHAGATIRLRNNISRALSCAALTNSVVLDLNGKCLENTGSSPAFVIDAAGKTVTITDGKSGGELRSVGAYTATLSAVDVRAGSCVVERGIVGARNASTDSRAVAMGILVQSGGTLALSARDSVYAIGGNGAVAIQAAGELTVDGTVVYASGAAGVRGIVLSGTASLVDTHVQALATGQDAAAVLNHAGADVVLRGGRYVAKAGSKSYALYGDGGQVLVVDGTYTASAAGVSRAVYAANTLHVEAGTFVAESTSGDDAVALYASGSDAIVTVDKGVWSAQASAASSAAVWLASSAQVELKDGTYASQAASKAYGVYSEGEVTIRRGVITATATGATAYGVCQNAAGKTSQIEGGKYRASVGSGTAVDDVYQQAGTLLVTGGTYVKNANLSKYASAVYSLNAESVDYAAGYRWAAGESLNAVVARADGRSFASLEDALDYANNNPEVSMTIILLANYTLPAGRYTLPAKATLLVPRADSQTTWIGTTPTRVTETTTPSLFRKLTLSAGVTMDVYGKIETSCQMSCSGQGASGYNGSPCGPYGQIVLSADSKVVLNKGAVLVSWGYITGEGEIDARRGSKVYQGIQLGDFKGGSITAQMQNNKQKVFLIYEYHIQNIEAKVKYRPGAREYASTGVEASSSIIPANEVPVVGTPSNNASLQALFLMNEEDDSEDSWVMQEYDAQTDYLIFSINNSASIATLNVNMTAGIFPVSMNSSKYVLPITNNVKVRLLSGNMRVTQDTQFLPGSELEIYKEATVSIDKGKTLYFVDQSEWGTFVYSNRYTGSAHYSPSWPNGKCPRNVSVCPASAKLNVQGTFDVKGSLHTTAGGAQIYSTNEDAGTIKFSANASGDGILNHFVTGKGNYLIGTCEVTYDPDTTTSAQLRNGDGTTTLTTGAKTGETYAYYLDAWRKWSTEGCFAVDRTGEPVYYAKPADYVALLSNEEDDQHLYTSADGSRKFILMDDCQWWEVEEVAEETTDDLYYCAKRGKYYYYDAALGIWKDKELTVTWKNWDGTVIETYTNVQYKSVPQYLGSSPSREKTDYKTYDFVGWSPEPAALTSDASFVAQYNEKAVKYNVAFRTEEGMLIEQQLVGAGEMPECQDAPAGLGVEYTWSPALHPVTEDVEYRMVRKIDKRNYTVTFIDWNGDEMYSAVVAAGVVPTEAAAEAEQSVGKDATQDYTYRFVGWQPTLSAASEDAVYVATYEEEPVPYTLQVSASSGGRILIDGDADVTSKTYPYGAKARITAVPDAGYYLQKWNDGIIADVREVTVTGDVTYTAAFANTYKVVLKTNGGSISQGNITEHTYGESETLPSVDDVVRAGYGMLGWYSTASFSGEKVEKIPANAKKEMVYYLKWGEAYEGWEAKQDGRTDAYYTTFYTSRTNSIVPEGFEAYRAEVEDHEGETYIHLRRIGDVIPSGEGVLLYSAVHDRLDIMPTDAPAPRIGQNDFAGTDVDMLASSVGGEIYVFSGDEKGVGFFHYTGTTLQAHKAYVVLPSEGGASAPRVLRFRSGPTVATYIDAVEEPEKEGVRLNGIYSLLGQELAEPMHGTLNIVNGELKYIP